jgi:WD40 repeat protein
VHRGPVWDIEQIHAMPSTLIVSQSTTAGAPRSDPNDGDSADWQRPAGRPYFVMDLVRGIPITEYCDKNNLTTNERLELLPTRPMSHIGSSPDGPTLAATNNRGDVVLFDPKTLRFIQHRPEALEMFGTNIAFLPDSHYFATPDCDHTVKIWDVRGGKLELH